MRLILLTAMLLFSHIAHSATLQQGSKSVGITFSGASIGSESYTILGASINYFAIDNLAVGAGYEYWFSGSPSVSKASIDSTYFIPASETIKPYAGLLFSHYFIDGFSDINSYGYRVGLAYINTQFILSAGIRQEKYSSDRDIFTGDDTTGEFVFGFSF